ncbi:MULTISPECIES: hypothetical protein [Pseudomonas syringae group]|uniref:hypothetical protein n=1 Tax=Pseudomonas syringae group TaxID=136849 RepID=UPI00106781E4|nr:MULTISPECIES: hypothetical protein [Pseudomonas syringae group]MCK9759884.1 hypothetical protein [Pseudomonas syringae pv. syringae]MCK9774875.1 hypothetical protein [Pseudomonas syringae pv. syringae]TES71917.1 hypothetical protein E2N89_30215 [Pseudomonas syringae pv. tomato]
MKHSLAHFVALAIAVALLDVGQSNADLFYTKAGFSVLAIAVVLLFTDIGLAVWKSFREDSLTQ